VTVVVYEADGYTKYRTRPRSKGLDLVELEPKRAYKQKIAHNEVDPDEIVGESNYSAIPIVPFWGSQHRQSDLVGMRSKIDAYDLVKSGFANDLEDCAQIYWIIGNALGMNDDDLAQFRDRLKFQHIAVMDTDNTNITQYQQEVPTAARTALIESLRAQIYEDYGGLDVHTVAAGATNDHIDAAYQPMDEEADDFEYQVIKAVRGILSIIGVDDIPIFQRNRLSNRMEQTQMVMMAANYLDDETVIRKLPFVTPDEVDGILARKLANDTEAFEPEETEEETEEQEETPEEV
jgi:SPP1 family phage portal protein